MRNLKYAVALAVAAGFGWGAFAEDAPVKEKKIVSITERVHGFAETQDAKEALFAVHVAFHIPGRNPYKHTHYFKPRIMKTVRYDDDTFTSTGKIMCFSSSVHSDGPNGWTTASSSVNPVDEGIKIVINERWGNGSNTPTGSVKHEMLLKWTDSQLQETEDGVTFDTAFEWFQPPEKK